MFSQCLDFLKIAVHTCIYLWYVQLRFHNFLKDSSISLHDSLICRKSSLEKNLVIVKIVEFISHWRSLSWDTIFNAFKEDIFVDHLQHCRQEISNLSLVNKMKSCLQKSSTAFLLSAFIEIFGDCTMIFKFKAWWFNFPCLNIGL